MFKVASYSFLIARNLVTREWLMARALKFARPTRGSPTHKVNKHGLTTLQTAFLSKFCGCIIFLKCLPIRQKAAKSLESNRRFKKLNNLSDSNNHRSRDTAVLVVVNATENKHKLPTGDSIFVDQVKKILIQTLPIFAKSSRLSSRSKFIQF